MAIEPCRLVAFDSFGGQVLFQQGAKWFRASADEQWTASELEDWRSAARCMLFATYEAREQTYPSADALLDGIAREWKQNFRVSDVPLAEIVHLFPEELRRAWETSQELRRSDESRIQNQSRRERRVRSKRGRMDRVEPYAPVTLQAALATAARVGEWSDLYLPRRPPLDSVPWQSVWDFARHRSRETGASDPDAEDIASATCLSLLQQAPLYNPDQWPPSQRKWREHVAAVVRNVALDTYRRSSALHRSPPGPRVDEQNLLRVVDRNSVSPLDALIQSETGAAIESAIDSLGPRDTSLAAALLDADMSLHDAIRQFGFSIASGHARATRVRQRLAEELRRRGVEPD